MTEAAETGGSFDAAFGLAQDDNPNAGDNPKRPGVISSGAKRSREISYGMTEAAETGRSFDAAFGLAQDDKLGQRTNYTMSF